MNKCLLNATLRGLFYINFNKKECKTNILTTKLGASGPVPGYYCLHCNKKRQAALDKKLEIT